MHVIYSSLFRIVALMKRIRKITVPKMNNVKLNFSGDITGPRTSIAITSFPTSYNAFDKPLRWSLSIVTNIISQLKGFVKYFIVTFLNDLTGLIIPFLFTMFRKVVKIGKGF